MLPKQSLTLLRWEEQVEKAFLGPSPDWILRMSKGLHVEETSTKQRGPTKIKVQGKLMSWRKDASHLDVYRMDGHMTSNPEPWSGGPLMSPSGSDSRFTAQALGETLSSSVGTSTAKFSTLPCSFCSCISNFK